MEPETKKMAMIAAGVFFAFILIMHLSNSPDYNGATTTTTTTHKSATVVNTNPNVYHHPNYNPNYYNPYKNKYYEGFHVGNPNHYNPHHYNNHNGHQNQFKKQFYGDWNFFKWFHNRLVI